MERGTFLMRYLCGDFLGTGLGVDIVEVGGSSAALLGPCGDEDSDQARDTDIRVRRWNNGAGSAGGELRLWN
jgi:hypothetical protein